MKRNPDNDFRLYLAHLSGWIACWLTVMAWVELTGGW